MASLDVGAFSNSFNAERDRGMRQRQYEDQQTQLARQNARVDTADAQNATVFQQGQEDRAKAQKADSLGRVGSIAQKALTITDPTQRKGFLQQSIGAYANDFKALGSDTSKIDSMLAMPDDQLASMLGQVAQFAPASKPIEVAKGGSIVQQSPDGKFGEVYKNPDAADAEKGAFTLGEGQQRFDASGKQVASVAPKAPTKPELFDITTKLRQEYNKQAADFTDASNAFQKIKDSTVNPSAAGDIALVFNYMKVLDPSSTVREGEFAQVAQSGGLPARVQTLYNKMVNGKLPDDVRADVVSRATQLYSGQEKLFNTKTKPRYVGLSKRYGIDPTDVISDPSTSGGGQPAMGPPPKAAQLPPKNAQGWDLHYDGQGNVAYVSPDGKQFQEVK